MKYVSVEFDNVLEREDVQEYIKGLIATGVKVYIVTMREPENDKDLIDNSDLWKVADEVGIEPIDVHFLSYTEKWVTVKASGVDIHIDADKKAMHEIEAFGRINTIDVNEPKWKDTCDILLELID